MSLPLQQLDPDTLIATFEQGHPRLVHYGFAALAARVLLIKHVAPILHGVAQGALRKAGRYFGTETLEKIISSVLFRLFAYVVDTILSVKIPITIAEVDETTVVPKP